MQRAIAHLLLVAVHWTVCWDTATAGEPSGNPKRPLHARPYEPASGPALFPLSPGAIEPQGWLRDWCVAARDGYTGHMDDYDAEFKRAWAADHQMKGEGLFWYKGAWPYEGGGYWFDGMARLGFALQDDFLIQQARRRFEPVVGHMHTNSLLFLWWLDRNNADDRRAVNAALEGWPIWTSGLLGRAMSGYYAGSGDPRILEALVKAYSSDPECLRSIRGSFSNSWPAYDAYCWTGNAEIAAALDALFKKEGGELLPNLKRYSVAPALKPGTTVDNAHMVEFLESTTPWAVGYLWTGESRYLEAAVGWHDLVERIAMQPHGVPVADEWYGPTGAFRGSETCDVAGYIWSQVCLFSVTGDGRMADRLERDFFNAGPVTVSRDFKTHVYFQSPNRFANLSPDFPHGPRASGGAYGPKHSPLCCTAALNRVVPWFATHLWMATRDNGLAAASYSPCRVKALVGDGVPLTLNCRTEYPFNDAIVLRLDLPRAAQFPLDLRIPAWCTNPELRVNGIVSQCEPNGKGFARVQRTWSPGDTVQLRLPMVPIVTQGRDNSSGPPYDGVHAATRVTVPDPAATRGAPYASVSCGPLLFAVAIPDTNDANTPDITARWRFALDVRRPELTLERSPMPSRWDWPLRAPVKIRARAVELGWNPDPQRPRLPALPVVTTNGVETVTLVPYGCTKFRISMLPVWAGPEVKPPAIQRVLFLGNSITLHGPKPDIGWTGHWGMAASSEEKDYVHLLRKALAEYTGTVPEVRVKNIADFERNAGGYDVDAQLPELRDFQPDLVVLAIGENVPPLSTDVARGEFRDGLGRILNAALASRHPLILVRSSFWADPVKDALLKDAAEQIDAVYVDAGSLGQNPAYAARGERSIPHEGVGIHPGDAGMKALSALMMQAIRERGAQER